jgi:hypothetical protein
MSFKAGADTVLARIEAELSDQGEPAVRMRRVLVFESDTGEFMLRARVAQALMTACDHGACQRLFQPLD